MKSDQGGKSEIDIMCGKIGLLIVLLLCAFYLSNAQNTPADTVTLALVNGEPVIMREFMQRAQKERSQVIRFFRINYGYEYDDDFWDKTFDGKTPSELLKEKTMDTLVQIKIQQIEAKKYGVVSDISYLGFLKALEVENLRRLEAKRNNKVIYGPVQYSEDVYYNYLFSNMVVRLKSVLSEEVFDVSIGKLKEAYEKDKDSLYRKGFYTVTWLIEMKFDSGITGEESLRIKNKANEALNRIKDMITHDESHIESAKEMYEGDPDLLLVISNLVYNDSIYTPEEDDPIRAMAKTKAEKLEAGQFSPVIEFPGEICLVLVKDKISLGYRSFEDCRSTVRESLTDQMYDQHINDLKLNAKVELNVDIYRQIHF